MADSPGALEVRLKDQVDVLDRAAAMVKPGGRIAYITCSVLPIENNEQVRAFIARHPGCDRAAGETAGVLWDKADDFAQAALRADWLMTPRHGHRRIFVMMMRA
jgi:16S rRNA (cytosine967-C5)-methyltransferase